MKSFFVFMAVCIPWIASVAQVVNILDGKWCFTGFRTSVFSVRNQKLYVALLEARDTVNFRRFLENSSMDSSIFVEATVRSLNDTLQIAADFPSIRHKLDLRYFQGNPNIIMYTGDVFVDSASLIRTNNNCQIQRRMCINKLYSASDVATISKLKPVLDFTRDHAFEFLLRVSFQLRDKCNRCYAGFTDAYMNEVFIGMGFNPITTQKSAGFTIYNTSGFTYFIKTKFEKDETLGRLSRLLLDQYMFGAETR